MLSIGEAKKRCLQCFDIFSSYNSIYNFDISIFRYFDEITNNSPSNTKTHNCQLHPILSSFILDIQTSIITTILIKINNHKSLSVSILTLIRVKLTSIHMLSVVACTCNLAT